MTRPLTTPVVLVTGVAPDAMAAATLALQFDLPHAAVVQHTLDVDTQRLTRVVSDLTGVVENVHHDLAHACVGCALREDIVPTLERLARSRRWGAIVVHLPVAAEALQVCRVVEQRPSPAPHVQIAAVVAAVDGEHVVQDLIGDDLLRDRGLHTSEDDDRGVGETSAAQVEYADTIVSSGTLERPSRDLLRTLARPDATLLQDPSDLDGPRLADGTAHVHRRTERWVDVVRRYSLPDVESEEVWRLDLQSDRPLHPGRLLAEIQRLGGGPRRSRGCFWLPSRPGDVCVWDGAGGQVSIGTASPWGLRDPLTRIVVTGLDDGAEEIREAFESCLLSDVEIKHRGTFWEVAEDGLEPWLGPIRRAA